MIEIQEASGSTIVNLQQERLDISVAQKLLSDLEKILERKAPTIILNLRQVNYMDSSVLGVLVQFQKKIKEAKSSLIVTGLSPSIKKIFELTKLNLFFTIKDA